LVSVAQVADRPAKNSAGLGVSITGICKSASVASSASTVLKVSDSSA
jgi:hypothetical protein